MKIKQLTTLIIGIILISNCKKNKITTPPANPSGPGIATVSTIPPLNISTDSALSGGVITLNNDSPVTESGVCFSVTPNPTVANNKVINTVANGSFSTALKPLFPSTLYYVKAYLINARGVTYGNQYSFTTTSNPLSDSTSYVTKLEEYFHSGNPVFTQKRRDYSFYYDNARRLVSVGMKSYSPVGFDTATCRLFYQGSAAKPYMMIVPNVQTVNPVLYDTVYYTYNVNNQILTDSSKELYNSSTGARVTGKRAYFYPDPTKTIIHYSKQFSPGNPVELARADTINLVTPSIMTQWYLSGNQKGNYAKTESFTYSSYINPLARLNIGGTICSRIYTPVLAEILGNQWHKAVFNSNAIAQYLDFYSAKIPSIFYIGGFTPGDFLLGAAYDAMTITVVPWNQRLNYPSEITVQMSSSLPYDSYIYKYYY